MPLDNTAKLSDIISALQTMEAINSKADLASVVGSPASADDTMATINSVIQGAKNSLATKMGSGSSGAEPLKTLVDNLVNGTKNFASGNGLLPSTDTKNFEQASGGIIPRNYVQLTGLDFNPTIVFVYNATVDNGFPTTYFPNGYYKYQGVINVAECQGSFFKNVNMSNDSGFLVPVSSQMKSSGKTVEWIAIG